MRRLESFKWWPKLVVEKDELSLRELAEKYNVTPGAISAALKREGVSRKAAPPGPRVHRARDEEDEEVPPEMGQPESPPQTRRIVRPQPSTEAALVSATGGRPGSKDDLILERLDLVGSKPDRDVAAEIGVSVRTLASFRSRHQITPYKGPRTPRKAGGRRSKIDPHRALLGTVPDRVVAEKAGVTLNAVRNYRVKHRIAAAAGPGRPKGSTNRKKAPDAPARVLAPSAGGSAFRVRFATGEERVAIALDLGDAFRIAGASGLGAVVGVDFIAQAI